MRSHVSLPVVGVLVASLLVGGTLEVLAQRGGRGGGGRGGGGGMRGGGGRSMGGGGGRSMGGMGGWVRGRRRRGDHGCRDRIDGVLAAGRLPDGDGERADLQ